MHVTKGIPASEGFAVGAVRRLRHMQTGLGRAVSSPAREADAYLAAAEAAKAQLDALAAKATADDRDIFTAQRLMLDDQGLTDEILAYIGAGAGAAAAVERAAGIYAGRMRALDDEYMRERACDILDACYRVVDVLDGQPRQELLLTSPAIIASEELYPTDILTLDRNMLLGVITSEGSVHAHAAILARTMGIPAVVMAGQAFLDACDGKLAAMDGGSGEVYLEPDEATKARFSHLIRLNSRPTLSAQRLREAPCVTADGTRISLFANCASAHDVRAAVDAGAEGVGLLSSEYLLARGVTGEEEQYRFYTECLMAADGRPVTISTYDLASDKLPAAPGHEPEDNPALGLCGVRYSLAHEEAFAVQLRALLRAGVEGNLRVALPMVNTRAEFERAMDVLRTARRALRAEGIPFAESLPVGLVLETPAAALTAAELAKDAAFFFIRPMNLAQYAFAADRSNAAVRAFYPPMGSAPVLALVRMALDAAQRANLRVCICCEDAHTADQAENYARMGVRALSVPAGSLLGVKESLRGISLR